MLLRLCLALWIAMSAIAFAQPAESLRPVFKLEPEVVKFPLHPSGGNETTTVKITYQDLYSMDVFISADPPFGLQGTSPKRSRFYSGHPQEITVWCCKGKAD